MYLEAAGNIRFESDKCLNRLYRGVECRTCVEQCPAEALSLEGGQLRFDEEACANCGLCLSHCNTGAFWMEEWDEQKLVASVLASDAETAVLFCGRHPAPYRRAKEEDLVCFQVPMCLGGLTLAGLFEIGAKKKLELMVDACEICEWRSCQMAIRNSAKLTGELLTACCGAGEVAVVEARPDGERGRKRKAVLSGEKACSRRQILFRLLDTGRRAAVADTSGPVRQEAPGTKRPVINNVQTGRQLSYRPEWADRLKVVYRREYEKAEEHGGAAVWPAIRVRHNCTNCNMCASFCPTGALRIEVEEGESGVTTASHYFQPMLCADCRLCEAACPIEAIVRDRLPAERPFVTQIICRGPVVPCKKCGALTYNVSSGRCHWCGSEASVDDIKRAVRLKLSGKK